MNVQGMRAFFIAQVILIFAGTVILHSAFAGRTTSQSGDLRVYCSNGFKPALEALRPQIEHDIGQNISPEFDSSKALGEKIQSGQPFDVVILSTDLVDNLVNAGKVSADTRTDIGDVGIGVGLRAGAPKPDINTPGAMKRLLLNSKSIAFNRDGASAVQINQMVEQLGVADRVKPKFIMETAAGQPQRDVVAGKAQIVITLIPEIREFPGLELIGPLPGNLQSYIHFSAGVAPNSRNAVAAKALIKFIIGQAAAPTLKSKGVDSHRGERIR